MPTFEYHARTKSGSLEEGIIEASSEEVALDLLQRKDLTVVSLREKRFSLWSIPLGGGIRQKDIMIFSRQLSTLFDAQVPVVEALRSLAEESTKESLRKIITQILEDVTGGIPVSQAFAKHPRVFSLFYLSLIRSGEEAGKLQEIFSYLADYLERSQTLTTKARNAMIYPAFILLAFIGVIVLLLVAVIPNLLAIFEETGQPVPFYTQIIIFASMFLKQWGWAVLLMFVGMGVFLWRWNMTVEGKEFLNKIELRAPLFGPLYRKLYLARLSDNLQILISSGIPILRALEITKAVVGNLVYQKAIEEAIVSVRGGNTISSAFKKRSEIPSMVTQMIRIGETSGRLDFILGKISKFYQQEVNSAVDNLISLIEPILIIVLGLGIGILVASVLVPIYNLVGAL